MRFQLIDVDIEMEKLLPRTSGAAVHFQQSRSKLLEILPSKTNIRLSRVMSRCSSKHHRNTSHKTKLNEADESWRSTAERWALLGQNDSRAVGGICEALNLSTRVSSVSAGHRPYQGPMIQWASSTPVLQSLHINHCCRLNRTQWEKSLQEMKVDFATLHESTMIKVQ